MNQPQRTGGHVWSDLDGNRCLLCGCTLDEFYDNLRPACHPVHNALVIFGMRARWKCKAAVRRLCRMLTI